jgi:GT2 family glycosyltransferase
LSWPTALPSVTVVLCTRRRPHALTRCLESLHRLQYPDVSILVIENDSVSSEAEDIAASYGAEYRLCTRQGLSAARNFGVRLSSSELLAFIDDDATCEPDWLVNAAPLFRDSKVQAVTGKILFHSMHSAHEPSHEFDPGTRTVSRTTPDWFGMANFGGLGLGSNFLVRRSAFDLVEGFDERLGRGASLHCSEENDLLFRILDAGYSVATCSTSVVRHPAAVAYDEKETFRSIAASTVMVTLLAAEHPRHLSHLFRYLLGAVARKPQSWRERPTQLFGSMGSRSTIYSALFAGPFIYLLATMRHAIYGTPQHEASLTTTTAVLAQTAPHSADGPVRRLRAHIS